MVSLKINPWSILKRLNFFLVFLISAVELVAIINLGDRTVNQEGAVERHRHIVLVEDRIPNQRGVKHNPGAITNLFEILIVKHESVYGLLYRLCELPSQYVDKLVFEK